VGALTTAQQEDLNLDILLPVAAAISAAGTDEERTGTLSFLRIQATVIANRIVDEGVRTRWFRGPIGSALADLASDPNVPLTRNTPDGIVEGIEDEDAHLLKLVVEGLSNEEIAERLGVDASEVARRLTSTYGKIGATSRADATAFAFHSRML
jgi:DNA-binding NarL/FixJ family response regulator